MIPESFIQELLNRVDVVDVIDKSVPLKKAGANYSACCPFHNEKSPSFTVSPTKQFYHCFGCGAHGTAVSFLMEYQGLSFVESIHELARMVGMIVPQETRDANQIAQSKAAEQAQRMRRLTSRQQVQIQIQSIADAPKQRSMWNRRNLSPEAPRKAAHLTAYCTLFNM